MSALDEMEERNEHAAYQQGYARGKEDGVAAENKRVLEAMGQLKDSCECIPLKEFAPDFDRGFHQAMTLVRGWIDQEVESLRLAQPEPKERDPE